MLADMFIEEGWSFQFKSNLLEREMQEIDLFLQKMQKVSVTQRKGR